MTIELLNKSLTNIRKLNSIASQLYELADSFDGTGNLFLADRLIRLGDRCVETETEGENLIGMWVSHDSEAARQGALNMMAASLATLKLTERT